MNGYEFKSLRKKVEKGKDKHMEKEERRETLRTIAWWIALVFVLGIVIAYIKIS